MKSLSDWAGKGQKSMSETEWQARLLQTLQALKKTNHFDLMGLELQAADIDQKELKQRYRALSKVFHPDKCSGKPYLAESKAIFQKLNEAYEVLSDASKRILYKAELIVQQPMPDYSAHFYAQQRHHQQQDAYGQEQERRAAEARMRAEERHRRDEAFRREQERRAAEARMRAEERHRRDEAFRREQEARAAEAKTRAEAWRRQESERRRVEAEQAQRKLNTSLTNAIGQNRSQSVNALLKVGAKPDYNRLFKKIPNTTHPEVLDLLALYQALPSGTSLSTLKFSLYAMGNTRIRSDEFKHASDIDWNGYVGSPSPMLGFSNQGNFDWVAGLIGLGVTSRPIDRISMLENIEVFSPDNYMDISAYRDDVSGMLEKFQGTARCIEALIQKPTEDLARGTSALQAVEAGCHPLRNFFLWAAMRDRVGLFGSPHFIKLLKQDRQSTHDMFVMAAVFGSVPFLQQAIDKRIVQRRSIEIAACVLVAQGKLPSLCALKRSFDSFASRVETFSGSFNRSLWLRDTPQDCHKTALYWAIFHGYSDVAKALLSDNFDPNSAALDEMESSYLLMAVRSRNADMVRTLLDGGARIDYQNKQEKTALHEAVSIRETAICILLIRSGADSSLLDSNQRCALDYCENEDLRRELKSMVKDYAVMKKLCQRLERIAHRKVGLMPSGSKTPRSSPKSEQQDRPVSPNALHTVT